MVGQMPVTQTLYRQHCFKMEHFFNFFSSEIVVFMPADTV